MFLKNRQVKLITGTAAIIEENDLILAVKRRADVDLPGYWEFPGGNLTDGETPKQCLKRVLKEVFGIESVVSERFGEYFSSSSQENIRLLGYLTAHTNGEFILTEHEEVRWFSIDELLRVNWVPACIPLVHELLDRKITEKNNFYYEANADVYVQETLLLDVEELRDKFICLLPPQAHILDLGCGSGRDSRLFLDRGYRVTAMDPSSSIAALASSYLGQAVQLSTAQGLTDRGIYDGVWACASLLHIPKAKMQTVMKKVVDALKPGGILYLSLKEGATERWDKRGRFLSDYSVKEISELLVKISALQEIDIFTSESMLRGKPQVWINVFGRKRVA